MGVKWKIPGERTLVHIGGHRYQAGVEYDNDMTKLPLKSIEPFIVKTESKSETVDTDFKEEEPKVVDEEPKELPSDEDNSEALKETIKGQFSVRELKAKAKEMGLSGYSKLDEDELATLLVKNGFKL